MSANQNGTPEIIDVHMHCFIGRRHGADALRDMGMLRRAGLRRMVVVGLVNTHLDTDAMWNLIPDFVENRGDPHFNETEELLALTELSDSFIIPLVDTRHLWGDVASELHRYLDRGFKGVKGIYLPDKDNDLGIGNVPDTFGITLEQYRRREWEIFSFAQSHDLPLLYHMDARRYGDVLVALLEDFPTVRVNFPHFGISRKSFCRILDRYPNVFTDFAGMNSYLRESPGSYRDFIMHYPDRVCFASDALLYRAGTVLDYIETVKWLQLPEEVESRVFYANPARFLGKALDRAGQG